MNKSKKKEDNIDLEKQEKIEKLINANPCPICRSRKMLICLCRSGGGGGSDESSNPNTTEVLSNQEGVSLVSILENSKVWKESKENDLEFNSAVTTDLFSVAIDISSLKLTFKGLKSLSYEDKQKLNEFYKRIEQELNDFKDELAKHGIKSDISFINDGDTLTITLPNKEQFDIFVVRLMNAGLIPKNESYTQSMFNTAMTSTKSTPYQSPNPFDISRGPLPPGEKVD